MSQYVYFVTVSRYAYIMKPRLVTDVTSLGAAVRDRRLALGLTQADVASKSGVSRAWVVRFEDGHPGAELGRVFALLRTLDAELRLSESSMSAAERERERYLSELLGD